MKKILKNSHLKSWDFERFRWKFIYLYFESIHKLFIWHRGIGDGWNINWCSQPTQY